MPLTSSRPTVGSFEPIVGLTAPAFGRLHGPMELNLFEMLFELFFPSDLLE
jgi:hypothetical protein